MAKTKQELIALRTETYAESVPVECCATCKHMRGASYRVDHGGCFAIVIRDKVVWKDVAAFGKCALWEKK